MAAPTFQAAGALDARSSGSTVTPAIPAGAQADDVMLVCFMCNDSINFTLPADWNEVPGTRVVIAAQTSVWAWKRHDGSEANPAATTDQGFLNSIGGYGRVYLFRGCATSGDPFEDATIADNPTNSNTPQSVAIDTTGPDRLVVSLVMVDDDNNWSSGMPPAGWSQIGRVSSTTGGDAMFDGIYKQVAAAGNVAAVNLGTMNASDNWATLTLALLPPAVTGPNEGSGSGSWDASGSAAGSAVREGSGSGSWTGAGAASGSQPPNAGTSSGAWDVTGSAVGSATHQGSSAGGHAWAGTAAGQTDRHGTASGSWDASGTAAGHTAHEGSGSGSWAASGVASGSVAHEGSAAGSWDEAGTASGTTPLLIQNGFGSGSWDAAGAASGITDRAGSAAGSWDEAGGAAGSSARHGVAGGSWAASGGTAGGSTLHVGSGAAGWDVAGAAQGRAPGPIDDHPTRTSVQLTPVAGSAQLQQPTGSVRLTPVAGSVSLTPVTGSATLA